MANILLDGEWYEEVSAAAMYESDFERLIVAQAGHLFPDYSVVPFKTLVYTDEEAVKADLALIDKEFRQWWVVEIELAHHSLPGHVLPQVRKLSRAAYGDKEADFICRQAPALPSARVYDLMKGKQPRVLVIVNGQCADWRHPLRGYDAHLFSVEIYRSKRNKHLLRLSDTLPTKLPQSLSLCFFDSILPGFLTVESPSSLGVPAQGKIIIYYEGKVTEWHRIDSQNKVWLRPVGPNPLPHKHKYELCCREDASLTFRQLSPAEEKKYVS